jgi:hypothetical protein
LVVESIATEIAPPEAWSLKALLDLIRGADRSALGALMATFAPPGRRCST